tara:strand:+ start:345 stop:896 length:552 start_codon:yes stop_codon:yes gene_type:complete
VHRNNILAKLDSYLKKFPDEQETVNQMVSFVEANKDCFERTLSIGHITGSAWLMDENYERALLTHHRKLDRWLQPGGHADGQSNVLAVAMRESEEESGLAEIEPVSDSLFDIDIHLIPARGNEAEHFHYDCRFLLRSVGSDQYTVSEESDDLAWILLSDMASYTSEVSITRMVDKVRSYLTYL